jgi:hypothetical protein
LVLVLLLLPHWLGQRPAVAALLLLLLLLLLLVVVR